MQMTETSPKALAAGDRVRVFGSYWFDDNWLDPSPDGYTGTVRTFIPGQNEQPAAVVELDREIGVDLPRDNGRSSQPGGASYSSWAMREPTGRRRSLVG